MGIKIDLTGTTKDTFEIGLNGVHLHDEAGDLVIFKADGSTPADLTADAVTAAAVNITGMTMVLNSADGESHTYSITAPDTADPVALTLPINTGPANYVLAADGDGTTTWVPVTGASDRVDSTVLAATVAADNTDIAAHEVATGVTLASGDVINKIQIIVDTPFDMTVPDVECLPSVTVGVTGTPAKYSAAGDVDLKVAGIYEVNPGVAAAAGSEAIVLTYTGSSVAAHAAEVGSARVLIFYATPS